jgi:alpha-D-ribose 1-methylphosphonate 5-triphosphate synthase subunit PhnH
MSAALARGFRDPVFDAGRAFRAVMSAMARPGTVEALGADLDPPGGITAGLAAVALALADHEAPLWLDEELAADPAIAAYLRFHTGAAVVADPRDAAFALVSDPAGCPPFERFAQGTLEYPDRSATLVIAVSTLSGRDGPLLAGPGVESTVRLSVEPLPQDFVGRWRANRGLFPRGLDLLFVHGGSILGLPRSSRIVEET